MNRYKLIISIVILIVSLIILIDKIFTTGPIQIILESGQEIVSQNSNYYTLEEVLLLIVSAFLVGLSAIFIYYNSDGSIKEYLLPKEKDKSRELLIANLLKCDEKKVYQNIVNSNGEILQNKLVVITGLSKVKITRILYGLEQKKLITKERYGFTNMVRLKRQ